MDFEAFANLVEGADAPIDDTNSRIARAGFKHNRYHLNAVIIVGLYQRHDCHTGLLVTLKSACYRYPKRGLAGDVKY